MTISLRAHLAQPAEPPDATAAERSSWLARAAIVVLLVAGALAGGFAVRRTIAASPIAPAVPTAPLFQLASKYLAAGQLDKARLEYLKIIKIDNLNVYAYYDIGDLYQSTGQLSAAANSYEKALLIKPNYAPALFNLAILETPTNPTAAVSTYKQLLSIEPKVAAPYFNLALLELHLGMKAAGNRDLTMAVSLDPSLYNRIPPSERPSGMVAPTAGK